MQLEQERGLLRVWGVGEGVDFNDGAQGPGTPESSNESDASSLAPGKEGLWGHPPTDHNNPSTSTTWEHPHPGYEGGLGPDGRPNFCSHVLRQLHLSYIQNFYTFYPFLNPSKLQRIFREFEE
jgi:hypothetical protein